MVRRSIAITHLGIGVGCVGAIAGGAAGGVDGAVLAAIVGFFLGKSVQSIFWTVGGGPST